MERDWPAKTFALGQHTDVDADNGYAWAMEQLSRIQLITDDPNEGDLAELLKGAGYDVFTATATNLPTPPAATQVVVMRLHHPEPLLGTVARLRRDPALPIICLSMSQQLDDRLAALDAGADDVMTEPYALEELLARIRVWTRRNPHPQCRWVIGELVIDAADRSVTRAGQAVPIPAKQFAILVLLARKRGQIVSRDQLRHEVWGYDEVDNNTIDVNVSQLRKRLGQAKGNPIRTIYGEGYRLVPDPRDPMSH
jgi:two-component system, OmpR family, KDP operon response regulator KdpE